MLVVRTKLAPSSTEGIGVFADEDIPKGTTVWKFDPRFDLYFDTDEVEKMGPLQKQLIKHHAALSKISGKYTLCGDNARFINHSSAKNNLDVTLLPGEPEMHSFANQDIKKGEELLIDYKAIDTEDAKSDEEYLKN